MRRFSDEDGLSAGWRNWGRLMLSAIPAAIGGAAVLWITAAFGWIDLTRELRMQRRTLAAVGLTHIPRDPIKLIAHDDRCMKVESAFLDRDALVFYAKNICSRTRSMPKFRFQAKAHDGTVLNSEQYRFDGVAAFEPAEHREQPVHQVATDDRVEVVELWLID